MNPALRGVNPQGTDSPQIPAKFAVTVKMSPRYIWSGSPVFSPIRYAAVGATGVRIASQNLNTSSKSFRISVRTFCARR